MDKQVIDLEAKRRERNAESTRKKTEEMLWEFDEGLAKLKSRACELSSGSFMSESCPRHLFALLEGDLRRVEERLQEIKEFLSNDDE